MRDSDPAAGCALAMLIAAALLGFFVGVFVGRLI